MVPQEPEPEELAPDEKSCSSEDELLEVCEGGMRVNNELRVINLLPVPIRGRGSGGEAPAASAAAAASAAHEPVTTSMGRRVWVPNRERDDIGAYGLYVGNWSGRRKHETMNLHIKADLIARSPAQVLMACEVDEAFTQELQNPTPIPAVVMGIIESVRAAPRPHRWIP